VILIAVGCCLAAAAYATTRSAPPASEPGEGSRPLRPRILVHPDPVTAEATATFDFSQPGRPPRRAHPGPRLRIECRLDDGPWEPCVGPVNLSGIDRGTHRFAVRAVNRAGNESPAADFVWRRTRAAKTPAAGPTAAPAAPEGHVTQPSPAAPSVSELAIEPPVEEPPIEEHEAPPAGPHFRIEQIGTLAELLPGAPAQVIPVRIENPNPNPITVTSLTAVIAADPPDCPAAENFVLTPAVLDPAVPLIVPAESSVSLPEAGIVGPTIAMVNLPTSQDACQEAELQIALGGEASG
jgi:hypothetical protein